ncbi:hypothetical protein BMS3Bbin01_02077 [bacterium BMS3Bbin01]|nr:hypothetical protein BMS3Bbin01_02077 [bacterium BMS3Bbin01]
MTLHSTDFAFVAGGRWPIPAGKEGGIVVFFSLEGEVPSPARRWGCTCQTPLLYPIDLGQNPEATSPARGRKKWGRSCLVPHLGRFFSLLPPGGGSAEPREAMGVYAPTVSPSTPSTSAKTPRPLPLPGEGRKWGRSCLCFPLEGEVPSLRGDGGVRARRLFSTPSTSAKTPRPLPLQGEGRKWGRSCLCFPLEGEVPSPARRWGCTRQTPLLYPIDLGQSPEATSPARGRKEPGSALVRGDTPIGFVAGARRVSPIGEDLYPIPLAALGDFPC